MSDEIDLSGWTMAMVEERFPGKYGTGGRSVFVFDEAKGCLVVRPEKEEHVKNSLLSAARRIALETMIPEGHA